MIDYKLFNEFTKQFEALLVHTTKLVRHFLGRPWVVGKDSLFFLIWKTISNATKNNGFGYKQKKANHASLHLFKELWDVSDPAANGASHWPKQITMICQSQN